MAKNNYSMSQAMLYQVARRAWGHCLDFIADFAADSPKYTSALVAAELDAIDAAEAIPTFERRNDSHSTPRRAMVKANGKVLNLWQKLKVFIKVAFPEDYQSKWAAAGFSHYGDANNDNWLSTQRLITDATAFMQDELAALTANNNMSPDFPASFAAEVTVFRNLYKDFDDNVDEAEDTTDEKITANNAVYSRMSDMTELGQRIFDHDEEKRRYFTIAHLKRQAGGNRLSGVKGVMKDAVTLQPIAGATVNAPFMLRYATTDAKGKYLLHLPHGSHYVEILAPGYETVVFENKVVKVDTVSRLSLNLTPAPVELAKAPQPVTDNPATPVQELELHVNGTKHYQNGHHAGV